MAVQHGPDQFDETGCEMTYAETIECLSCYTAPLLVLHRSRATGERNACLIVQSNSIEVNTLCQTVQTTPLPATSSSSWPATSRTWPTPSRNPSASCWPPERSNQRRSLRLRGRRSLCRGGSLLPGRHQRSDDCLVWSDLEGLPEWVYRQLQGYRLIHD